MVTESLGIDTNPAKSIGVFFEVYRGEPPGDAPEPARTSPVDDEAEQRGAHPSVTVILDAPVSIEPKARP